LTADVEGEIETENKVLIIKRIRVTYHLKTSESNRETVERVHGVHHQSCPVYMSLYKAIDISTELRIEVE
jgi:uncharacterized OsmC-like protein